MEAVVAAFNQEKALVGAFSVIVQPVVEPMDRFTALLRISQWLSTDRTSFSPLSLLVTTSTHVDRMAAHSELMILCCGCNYIGNPVISGCSTLKCDYLVHVMLLIFTALSV